MVVGPRTPDERDHRGKLLTVRNLLLLTLAGLGTHAAIPALVPSIEATNVQSFVAFIVVLAALDRIVR